MTHIKAFIGFSITFLVIDSIWINLVVINLYREEVAPLMADSPNVLAAMLFYVLYTSGCVWFAIKPNLQSKSVAAFVSGAALGAFAYGTFTLTNYAVLDGWTARIVITDILWGTVLTGLSASAGHWLATRNAG